MKPIVIDASMAANWELDDEQNEAANQILDEIRHRPLITTSIFWHEMRSIFLASEKRGRTEQGEPLRLLQHLRALGIKEQQGGGDALILGLASRYGLSAYDAAYLALAVQAPTRSWRPMTGNWHAPPLRPVWNCARRWIETRSSHQRLDPVQRFQCLLGGQFIRVNRRQCIQCCGGRGEQAELLGLVEGGGG